MAYEFVELLFGAKLATTAFPPIDRGITAWGLESVMMKPKPVNPSCGGCVVPLRCRMPRLAAGLVSPVTSVSTLNPKIKSPKGTETAFAVKSSNRLKPQS